MKKQFRCNGCSIIYQIFTDTEKHICGICHTYTEFQKDIYIDPEESARSMPYNFLEMKNKRLIAPRPKYSASPEDTIYYCSYSKRKRKAYEP